MRTADADTLYIFFKNERTLYLNKKACDRQVLDLYRIYNNKYKIKRKASFFAEIYIPFMQRHIFDFLIAQKEMECPYKMPSKAVMLETAKIFAEEYILDFYGEKVHGTN